RNVTGVQTCAIPISFGSSSRVAKARTVSRMSRSVSERSVSTARKSWGSGAAALGRGSFMVGSPFVGWSEVVMGSEEIGLVDHTAFDHLVDACFFQPQFGEDGTGMLSQQGWSDQWGW